MLKKWIICAVLFLICFLILRFLNGEKNIEGHCCGRGCGFGHGCMGRYGYGYGGRGYWI